MKCLRCKTGRRDVSYPGHSDLIRGHTRAPQYKGK